VCVCWAQGLDCILAWHTVVLQQQSVAWVPHVAGWLFTCVSAMCWSLAAVLVQRGCGVAYVTHSTSQLPT
jgi:uncharacterized membrane protein YbhN (UPF0104 family)